MNRRLLLLFLASTFALAATAFAEAPPQKQPNILFIYTDDQALWSIHAYGNNQVETPNLDRLAREGALFTQAFTATPVCSPSRASMMTSRYPTEFGIDDWINPRTEPDLGLAPSFVIWPQLLKGAGYRAMLIGKWHLGTRDEFHPTRRGYDAFYGFRDGGNTPRNPRLEVEGVTQIVQGDIPDLFVDEALIYLGTCLAKPNRDRPFLLSVHFREPHAPYTPFPLPDDVYSRLDPKIPQVAGLPVPRVKQLTRDYYSSVHAVDRNVGRLLNALDRNGLSDNTIVIFTSDHGYMIGHHGLWHKGNATWLVEGKKGPRPNMFDDAVRVPLLIRWPGVVKPGTTVSHVVSNLDFLPTLLEMTGTPKPENLVVRGRSMVPLLKGEEPSPAWDDTLFGQYDMHHTKTAHMRMIRTPRWKLIRHFEPEVSDELYHLGSDPNETTNRIDDPAAKADLSSLRTRLAEFMTSLNDPFRPSASNP